MKTLSIEPKIETPPKFIIRLYAVIDDPSIKSIVWSSDGASFLITDKEEFQKTVLPMISKTTEFSGFIRQLNAYGFKKKNTIDANIREYAHQDFLKSRFDLLTKLSRKTTGIVKAETLNVQNNMKFLNESNFHLTSEILVLKNKIEEQDKKIKALMEMIQQMFNLQIDKNEVINQSSLPDRRLNYQARKNKSPKFLRSDSELKHDTSFEDFF